MHHGTGARPAPHATALIRTREDIENADIIETCSLYLALLVRVA